MGNLREEMADQSGCLELMNNPRHKFGSGLVMECPEPQERHLISSDIDETAEMHPVVENFESFVRYAKKVELERGRQRIVEMSLHQPPGGL